MTDLRHIPGTIIDIVAGVIGVTGFIKRGNIRQGTALLSGIGHLAPGGADQLIQGVVSVSVFRHHFLIMPESRLLGAIGHTQHIADLIVFITQILKYFFPCRMFGFDSNQALGLRFISVSGHYTVTVLLTQLLPGSGIRHRLDNDFFRSAFHRHPAGAQ
ncbi:Uncharacterised protein [Klebsiella pneumoniae]|nr:Uncharacterised protein [Klebsiella pneumoniae]